MGFTFVIFPFVGLCQTLSLLWSCMHRLISHPQIDCKARCYNSLSLCMPAACASHPQLLHSLLSQRLQCSKCSVSAQEQVTHAGNCWQQQQARTLMDSLSGSMNFWWWNSCSSSISMRWARWPCRALDHREPDRLLSWRVRGSTFR